MLKELAAAAAKSLQSSLTLCDPIDGSAPGSPVPGILQVRTLEWVAISSSNVWKWKVKVKSLNRVWLIETPRTAAQEAPPFMGFSRQEYWSRVPLPSPERAYTRANTQKQKILILRLHEITKYAKVTDFTGTGWITFPSIRKSKGSRQKLSLVLLLVS